MPKIFGVLNITEDSFSDGGTWLAPEAALTHAAHLVEAGADVVDIGAIASNPDAIAVPIAEEISRLGPVIASLHARGVAVSVDSFRPETQLYALSRGVAFLNDIHGFPHREIYPALAEAPCRLVVMHSVHGAAHVSREDLATGDIVEVILRFFEERVRRLTGGGDRPFAHHSGPRHGVISLAPNRRLRSRRWRGWRDCGRHLTCRFWWGCRANRSYGRWWVGNKPAPQRLRRRYLCGFSGCGFHTHA